MASLRLRRCAPASRPATTLSAPPALPVVPSSFQLKLSRSAALPRGHRRIRARLQGRRRGGRGPEEALRGLPRGHETARPPALALHRPPPAAARLPLQRTPSCGFRPTRPLFRISPWAAEQRLRARAVSLPVSGTPSLSRSAAPPLFCRESLAVFPPPQRVRVPAVLGRGRGLVPLHADPQRGHQGRRVLAAPATVLQLGARSAPHALQYRTGRSGVGKERRARPRQSSGARRPAPRVSGLLRASAGEVQGSPAFDKWAKATAKKGAPSNAIAGCAALRVRWGTRGRPLTPAKGFFLHRGGRAGLGCPRSPTLPLGY